MLEALRLDFLVYPPAQALDYSVGDTVFIRPKGAKERGKKGVVVKHDGTKSGATGKSSLNEQVEKNHQERRLIKVFNNNKLQDARVSRLLPVFRSKDLGRCIVLLTAETQHFRNICMANIDEHDIVLEVGSSFGECSFLIAKYAHYLLGLDVSDEALVKAQSKCRAFHNFDFRLLDVIHSIDQRLEVEEILKRKMARTESSLVICIDIGGDRAGESIVHCLMPWVTMQLKPRLIIIKNEDIAWNCTLRHEEFEVREQIMLKRGRKRRVSGDATNRKSVSQGTKLKFSVSPQIMNNGQIDNGQEWWESLSLSELKKIKHPQQAPKKYDLNGNCICRYHNFHVDGCLKYKTGECSLNHIICYNCMQSGHRALDCSIGKQK